MLFGNINKLSLLGYCHKDLSKWIEIAWHIAQNFEAGNYDINQNGVFVTLAEVQTEPREARRAEVHKEYLDVQILLHGEEAIGYALDLSPELMACDELEGDIAFIDEVSHEQFALLRQVGDFVVLHPNEIHTPLCAIDKPQTVRKAILKIPAKLLHNSV